MDYATAAHKCCCGCGGEVITPLSPTDWNLTYDGETISLSPSIGNWGFDCMSHYWIQGSRVQWAPRWSKARIKANRSVGRKSKERFYARVGRQWQLIPQQTINRVRERFSKWRFWLH